MLRVVECTSPRMNLNVYYILWVIMIHQIYWSIFSKCITLVEEVVKGRIWMCVGRGEYGESLYFPLNFCYEIKLVLRKDSINNLKCKFIIPFDKFWTFFYLLSYWLVRKRETTLYSINCTEILGYIVKKELN